MTYQVSMADMIASRAMAKPGGSLQTLFGHRLRALRAERDWTAAEVAARVGCTESYYCRLEGGRQGPAFPLLAALSRAFGVDELDLFTFPGATERHDIMELLRHSPAELRLQILETLREALVDQIRAAGAARPSRRAAR
jgi:transcriptional regulator with XRE-family HTH domain